MLDVRQLASSRFTFSTGLALPLSFVLGLSACGDSEGDAAGESGSTSESGSNMPGMNTENPSDEGLDDGLDDDGLDDDGNDEGQTSRTTTEPDSEDGKDDDGMMDDGDETDTGGMNETGMEDEGTGESGEMACVDPETDCPAPSGDCMLVYCDENDECAERKVEDEFNSEWSEWSVCEYDNECVETGDRVRTREYCDMEGKAKVLEERMDDVAECDRDTSKKVVEGDWGECKAEASDKAGECVEMQYRVNTACVEGKEKPVDDEQECDADEGTVAECKVCGNGVAENYDGYFEACDPAAEDNDYCSDDCTNVIYVDINVADGGAGDGSSWANAYKDLQAAMNKAAKDFVGKEIEVWVANGTYIRQQAKPEEDRKGFELPAGVRVYGGFTSGQGKREQREADPSKNMTVLSGDLGEKGKAEDNSVHVVDFSNANANSGLDGFTISDGNADKSSGSIPVPPAGGGLYAFNVPFPAPAVEDNRLITVSDSGQIPLGETTPMFSNLLISGNSTSGTGGGIGSTGVNISFGSGVVVRENSAEDGGGMALSGNTIATVSGDATFEGNKAVADGGDDGRGGAIFVGTGARLRVNGELVIQAGSGKKPNTAKNGGGIYNIGQILVNGKDAKLSLDGNEASDDGGGFYNMDGARSGGTIQASNGGAIEIDNNTAKRGGGFFNDKDANVDEGEGTDKGSIAGDGNKADKDEGGGFYNNEGVLSPNVDAFLDVKGADKDDYVNKTPAP